VSYVIKGYIYRQLLALNGGPVAKKIRTLKRASIPFQKEEFSTSGFMKTDRSPQ